MIVGNSSIFAIESEITQGYERVSLRALGFFVIHISGHRYGVHRSDATMLARSFDEVGRRVNDRGAHTVPFSTDSDAGKIADAFRSAVYADEQEPSYFGITLPEFCEMFRLKRLVWAPDGDEAFDDGSYVLQFDIQDCVRLIAFKCRPDGRHDPATISDLWIAADDFYAVLQHWHEAFEAEWTAAPKVFDQKDG